MGVGGQKPSMHEIDDTRSAGRDEAFEMIIERIKSAGGEIIKDATSALYTELGADEVETGSQRVVEFTLNRMDFRLTRNVEKFGVRGDGRNKHLEELTPPRIKMSLKRKAISSNDWQVVDLEDMF